MKEIKYGSLNEELTELCPVCSNEYTHIEKLTKNDHEQSDIRLHFWGECGHRWFKEWETHKGNTFLRAYVKKEERIL